MLALAVGRVLVSNSSIEFYGQPAGAIAVYREPSPGKRYVIGGDTAGEGSDYFVAQVLDEETGEQVCTLRGRMDEDLYARQLYCLGEWYNQALIAVECNFSRYPIRELEQMGYPNQYARIREDGESGYGFRTTSATRPMILAGLVETVREHVGWLNDPDTLREMLSFVRNRQGRPEAQAGAHDDCVMALAIAYHVREGQRASTGGESWSYAVSRF